MKYIDMHMHTTASDGDDRPLDLLEKLKKQSFGYFAFTDHDTIDSIKIMEQGITEGTIDLEGLTFIRGCEFSATINKRFTRKGSQLHILAYDFDIDNPKIKELIIKECENRKYNFKLILNYIQTKWNIKLNHEEIETLLSIPNVTRPHLSHVLIKHNYVEKVQEAFDKYLTEAYVETYDLRKTISDIEVIKTIHESNGLVSMAHPFRTKLNSKELSEYYQFLIDNGARPDALEIYYSSHNQEDRINLKEIADKYKFLISGGSDYHGMVAHPEINLGKGIINNTEIDDLTLLKEILARKN